MAEKPSNQSGKRGGKPGAPLDFESTLAEVENVVRQLEGGELGLTESLAQYEKGIEKIKLCHQVLEKAEKRIAVLTGVREDGTAEVEPVELPDEANDSLAAGSASRKRRVRKKTAPPSSDVDSSEGLF